MSRYTKHASKRVQQRAIDEALIAAVTTMGHEFHDKDGSVYISTNKGKQKALAKKLRKLADKLEHRDPVFLVENSDGSLRTAGRQYRRHKRH